MDRAYAKLSFHYRWQSDNYPGARNCFFEVYNNGGYVIGAYESRSFEALSQERRSEVTVPIHGIPDSGTGICVGKRLDDPSGRLSVTNVRVGPTSGTQARVIWDWKWTGHGRMPTQQCSVTFLDEQAKELFSGNFTFATIKDRGTDDMVPLRAPHRLTEEPVDAEMRCRDY